MLRAVLIPLFVLSSVLVAAGVESGGGERDAKARAKFEAHQWLAAKFLGIRDERPAAAQMMVYLSSGLIQKNRRERVYLSSGLAQESRRESRMFFIRDQRYERGLAMPSPGEVVVRLPSAAATFEAVVGVDSNDLGYYSNAGRGSVVAAVEVGGREAFRSGTIREGLAAVPVKVDLAGAREFRLKLAAVGERPRGYKEEWDQADWAQAKVTLSDGKVMWLDELALGPLPGPYSTEPPFSFRYGGRPSSDLLKTWMVSRSSRAIDADRTEYVATYTDPQTGLVLRCVAVAYGDFPVIEWTLYFSNTGASSTPIIEGIEALDAQLESNGDGEFVLHHSKGSALSPTDYEPFETILPPASEQRISAAGGRPTSSDLCYFNVAWPGEGAIIAIGWPGQWAARFKRDEGYGLRIRIGQELTHFRLLPGEQVRTPLIAMLFWKGDWIGGQNLWRRWMIAHNSPRLGGAVPPPQLAVGSMRQTHEMQEANEENQKEFLKRYLDAGVPLNYWWMDAGWYPFKTGWWNTGTWEPDPARFPHGLAPISAAAHARGVKTILWFEPERVFPGSWLYEKHPEWLIGPEVGRKLLDLGNPEAWQWLVDRVSKLIREQGIDVYRQDFNFEPLALWRANDADDRQGITEIKHVTGYLAFWDELRRRFPNLLIDTCSSGARRSDLETLRRAVPLWRSDYVYEPAAMQQQTYGMALWIPFFGTAFNSLDPYVFRSQMTPAMLMGLEPVRYENGYERLRHLLAQWREVADDYYGDYYPLTPYQTESTEWMAWQFDRPERGEGMVQAFRRPDSPFETARFELRGLDATAPYVVTDLDSRGKSSFTGGELMREGLPVSIKSRPGAVIITYRKATR